MKLLISEKVYQYRKRKNMTQEELAASVGVSPQAVSGWERGCGYPDITLLPGIAHALGITIDELMGNDELGVQEDIEGFYGRLWRVGANEKLRMAVEYYHKYPDVYDLADTLIHVIDGWGFADAPEYKVLLCEAAERIVSCCTDNRIRYRAIEAMCRHCGDGEVGRWLDMCPQTYSSVRGEVMEERLWRCGDTDGARVEFYKTNLSIMLHLVARESHHQGDPERSISHNDYLCRLIRSFGEGGEVPDGWVGKYAFIRMRYAAGLFGAGRTEEGFAAFAEALAAYERLFAIPDEVPLGLGCRALFGDIRLIQQREAGMFDEFASGGGTRIEILEGGYYTQNAPYLYNLLTEKSGWEWFNGVRGDPRFKEAVAWAKDAAERFEEARR